MDVFSLQVEQEFDAKKHVEKILGEIGGGDVTVACWEPGQISPYHCHPHATEIYFCYTGGGTMRTPETTVDVKPGAFVVASAGRGATNTSMGPNGPSCSASRRGSDMASRHVEWRGHPDWKQRPEDAEYYRRHPIA